MFDRRNFFLDHSKKKTRHKQLKAGNNLEILVKSNEVSRLECKTEEVREWEPKPSVGKHCNHRELIVEITSSRLKY